ncbi:hypothetical protein D3C71_2027080 [compost metagenome]
MRFTHRLDKDLVKRRLLDFEMLDLALLQCLPQHKLCSRDIGDPHRISALLPLHSGYSRNTSEASHFS